MRLALIGTMLLLVACEVPDAPEKPDAPKQPVPVALPADTAKRFAQIVARVEPVGEAECRKRTRGVNCNFLVRIDPNRAARANAYQGEDSSGRPIITFTRRILAQTPNTDELAFVLGHEMAHHISGHLRRQKANAKIEADEFASLAELTGGSASDVANAQKIGAVIGALKYSQEFELEADKLGTIITHKAGYNPLIGSNFFNKIPDPGDSFLGTHPPNKARFRIVRETSRSLGVAE